MDRPLTLAPGEQLRDQELASWLGVSRTPVREAMLRLAEAGLVQTAPGRSTTVAQIDPGVRRLERLRFASHGGQASVELHDELVAHLTAGDAERAAAASDRTWATLQALLESPADDHADGATPFPRPRTTTRKRAAR